MGLSITMSSAFKFTCWDGIEPYGSFACYHFSKISWSDLGQEGNSDKKGLLRHVPYRSSEEVWHLNSLSPR